MPEGYYFAMGDNRDNSQDSRFWGYVPRSAIIGRAMFVYWSYDESAPRSNAPFPFNYLVDFFANTRWRRTSGPPTRRWSRREAPHFLSDYGRWASVRATRW